MRTCQGCGGILGQDCFNEQECIWIGQQQDNDAYQKAQQYYQLSNDMDRKVNHLSEIIGMLCDLLKENGVDYSHIIQENSKPNIEEEQLPF